MLVEDQCLKLLSFAGTSTTYRIKITGFHEAVTPDSLKQLLGSTNLNCYVDSSQDRVGYVVKIRTRKYAKRLMTRWHNNNIGGQQLKCQLEVNPTLRDRSQSRGPRSDRRTRYPQSDTSSVRSSQEKSNLGDDDRDEQPVFDEREVGRDARIFRNAVQSVTPNARQSSLRPVSSTDSIPTSAQEKCRCFLTARITNPHPPCILISRSFTQRCTVGRMGDHQQSTKWREGLIDSEPNRS